MTKLFVAGGIEVSPEERQLLTRLSQFVVWRGRYPIPLSREAFRAGRVPSWVISPYPVEASASDREAAYRLFDRVISKLPG